jgi:hypothetical protein
MYGPVFMILDSGKLSDDVLAGIAPLVPSPPKLLPRDYHAQTQPAAAHC